MIGFLFAVTNIASFIIGLIVMFRISEHFNARWRSVVEHREYARRRAEMMKAKEP